MKPKTERSKTPARRMSLIVIGCAALLAGCDGSPHHTVIENGRMKIYHAEKLDDAALGQWEYWVRDNSNKGWRLVSDQEFKVGDELTIQSR